MNNLKAQIREAYQRDPQVSGEALLKSLNARLNVASRAALVEVQNELRPWRPGIRYTEADQRHFVEGTTLCSGRPALLRV